MIGKAKEIGQLQMGLKHQNQTILMKRAYFEWNDTKDNPDSKVRYLLPSL
jgi:hypothetical protein